MRTMLSVCAAMLALGTFASVRYVKPDISYRDGLETITTNPARGHAGGGWVTFKPEGLPKWHGGGGYHSSLWELSRFSGGREQNGKRPHPAERVGAADIPLTEAMKADVRRFLTETRAAGGSLIVRLGYTWSDQPGCEPDNFEVALGHVRELSQIMRDFDDVVVGVEAGIAGPWGEMHTSDYCRPEYMNRVLRTYLDNLGARTPVLVRAPGYFCKLAETNTVGLLDMLPFQDRYLKRLGMYNDGYLGTWWDYGTWAGDFTRERGCQLLRNCDHIPYGGEMAYVGKDWLAQNREKCGDLFNPEKWNIVRDWYDVQLNYLRNISEGGHSLAEYLRDNVTFDSARWKFDGMPDLTEYDGTNMNKFVMDHMGYRYVVRDARLPEEIVTGEKARLALDIENTGFGRLLLPTAAEAVLVSGEKAVATVARINLDLRGGQRKRMAMDFTVPDDLAEGVYTVLLRVRAPLRDESMGPMPRRPIRLANAGMWDARNLANRLGTVRIIKKNK